MLDVWLGSEYAFGLPLDFYPGISEIMRTSIFRIISNGLVLVALHFFGIQNISICSAYHYIMELINAETKETLPTIKLAAFLPKHKTCFAIWNLKNGSKLNQN